MRKYLSLLHTNPRAHRQGGWEDYREGRMTVPPLTSHKHRSSVTRGVGLNVCSYVHMSQAQQLRQLPHPPQRPIIHE